MAKKKTKKASVDPIVAEPVEPRLVAEEPVADRRSGRLALMIVTAIAFVALGGWSLTLLTCEPDPRNDAHFFVDQVGRIDLDSPLAERRALVERLAAMPLASEEVKRARDVCVRAHRTLIRAEDLQNEVRSALGNYHNEEARIPPTERIRLDRSLSDARDAIDESHALFARCGSATRALETRYGSRRR